MIKETRDVTSSHQVGADAVDKQPQGSHKAAESRRIGRRQEVEGDSIGQIERFKEVARQLGADESPDALDRAMDRLDLRVKLKAPEAALPQASEEADKD